MVAASAYMTGTRGSGVLSSGCDMLEMSVVRGVGGVCDMCICLARAVWGFRCWVKGMGLGFTYLGGTRGKCDMCLSFDCGGVGGVGGVVGRLGSGRVVLSLCLL